MQALQVACMTSSQLSRFPRSQRAHLVRRSVSPFPLSTRKLLHVRQNTSLVVRASDRLPGWDYIWSELSSKKLRSLEPEGANSLIKNGQAVLVDVRLKADYDKAHPKGAQHVPLFQLLDWSDPSVLKVFKFIACVSNGVTAVEINPKFVEDLKQAANGKNVILACETGGTIQPTVNFKTGKASRSLKAAYKAVSTGVPFEIQHLNGGVYGWYRADLPFDGEYDASNAGKSPNIAEKPTGAFIKD